MNSRDPDGPSLYRRWCPSCGRLDNSRALIAATSIDGERGLRAEPWACPRCGGTAYVVATAFRDGDLDEANLPPVPIHVLRELRRIEGGE